MESAQKYAEFIEMWLFFEISKQPVFQFHYNRPFFTKIDQVIKSLQD